ncbi:MAG: hypothetical protein CYG60_00885 [Actinobacteria bacterium]|nr:MAG: hypothetical protein CYG60_00885 [Actinomycetota bacterium]
MSARTAVLGLLKESGDWRRFFKACCETSPFKLRSQSWQFREVLAERGCVFPEGSTELEDALLQLSRELMPDSPAARWDEEWAFALCKEALARIAGRCAGMRDVEVEVLDLSAQDEWNERMCEAVLNNDPAAFRLALKRWELVALEAIQALQDEELGSPA